MVGKGLGCGVGLGHPCGEGVGGEVLEAWGPEDNLPPCPGRWRSF